MSIICQIMSYTLSTNLFDYHKISCFHLNFEAPLVMCSLMSNAAFKQIIVFIHTVYVKVMTAFNENK